MAIVSPAAMNGVIARPPSIMFQRAPFDQARDAARAVGVRHRAAAQDRAGREARACARCGRSDRRKRSASRPRRDRRPARRCRSSAAGRWTRPSRHAAAQLVGRDRERRERGRRLRLEEAEPLGQLVGRPGLRSVMSLASISRRTCARASAARVPCGRVAEDRPRPRSRSRGPRPDRRAGCRRAGPSSTPEPALVDQRIGLQRGGRRGAARRAHPPHVLEERRPVDPFVRARQRRSQPRGIQRARLDRHRRAVAASAASAGAARSQSSSAACSVGAIAAARA